MSQQSLETYVLTGKFPSRARILVACCTSHWIGSIKIIERFFELPLDYANPDGQKIQIFARNMVPLDKAKTSEQEANLPYCKLSFFSDQFSHEPTAVFQVVYLQGKSHTLYSNACSQQVQVDLALRLTWPDILRWQLL